MFLFSAILIFEFSIGNISRAQEMATKETYYDDPRWIKCWPQYTPDQLVRAFEPEIVKCYGSLYEDTSEILQTMCYAVSRQSGDVIRDYEKLSTSLCPLWKKRTYCLWKFIGSKCSPSEFEIISEIRRTSLIAVGKEALCNETIKNQMKKFLELGGARCFCSSTLPDYEEHAPNLIISILNCTSNFYKTYPLAGIPFKIFRNFLEKARDCGTPVVEKCLLGNGNKTSEDVKRAFSDFIDGLTLAQESLRRFRQVT